MDARAGRIEDVPPRRLLVGQEREVVADYQAGATIEADALSQIRMRRSYGEICRRLVERMGKEQGIAMAGGLLAQWPLPQVLRA